MSDPVPPSNVVETFKARCAMGLVGVSSSEGTLYCDLPRSRTRFEAFGGWSVTRFDLGISASHYVKSNPPDVKLHEEPMMSFAPPNGATYGGTETIDGKECQKWSFKQVGKAMTTEVDEWLFAEPSGEVKPVVYRMKTPTQTIEMKFLEIEPMAVIDDALFAVEQYIPSEKPPTVPVVGVMTNEAGERIHGVSVCASHPDGRKAEWTTRTAAQSNEQGEFELMLTPNDVWRVTVQGAPKYNARIFEITPPSGGIAAGGAADVVMQPNTGGQVALGNPGAGGAAYGGAYPNTATTSVSGGAMGGAGAAYPPGMAGGGMYAGYSTTPMSMEQMMAAQQRQQAAMGQAHAALGMAAGQFNAAGNMMSAMGYGGAAAQLQHGAARAQMGQQDVAMGAMQQQGHFNAAMPAMAFHAQMQGGAAPPPGGQQQGGSAPSPSSNEQKQTAQPAPTSAPAAAEPTPASSQPAQASTASEVYPTTTVDNTPNQSSPAASANDVKTSPAPATQPAQSQNADKLQPKQSEASTPAPAPAASPDAPNAAKQQPAPAPTTSDTAAAATAAAAAAVAAASSAAANAMATADLITQMNALKLSSTAEKFSVGRTGLFSNWKKRLFKQTGNVVQYFEREGSPVLGTITVNSKTTIHSDPTPTMHKEAKHPDRDMVIEFPENGKQLKLLVRFANAADKQEWVRGLDIIKRAMAASGQ